MSILQVPIVLRTPFEITSPFLTIYDAATGAVISERSSAGIVETPTIGGYLYTASILVEAGVTGAIIDIWDDGGVAIPGIVPERIDISSTGRTSVIFTPDIDDLPSDPDYTLVGVTAFFAEPNLTPIAGETLSWKLIRLPDGSRLGVNNEWNTTEESDVTGFIPYFNIIGGSIIKYRWDTGPEVETVVRTKDGENFQLLGRFYKESPSS